VIATFEGRDSFKYELGWIKWLVDARSGGRDVRYLRCIVELTNGFAEASSNLLFVSVNALRRATATALSALFRSRSACTTSLKPLITPKFA
jgi:hypothetical protein